MALEFELEVLSPLIVGGERLLPHGSVLRFSVETDGKPKDEVRKAVTSLFLAHCSAVFYKIKDWNVLPDK